MVGHKWWKRWLRVVVAGSCVWLVACSPSHNWREVAHDGVPLRALMPCKPERAEREVPLSGAQAAPLTLRMMSCQVDGATFAVAVVRLPAGETADPVIKRWAQAAWFTLKQTVPAGAPMPEGWTQSAVSWPGAKVAQAWTGPGVDHLGQPLQAQLYLGSDGAWVVQAAWYGQHLAPEVRDTFFDALRFEGM